ncbi:MAG: hypothetical protein ABJE95_00430 [Byssovorax sp.]
MTTHLDRWHTDAVALVATENPLRVPYDVFLSEAGQVAKFFARHWEPTPGLPGLSRVKARLPKSTGDDILSLVHATQEQQTRLLLLVDPVVVDQGERARFLIDELESALEFLLDDDVTEEADTQLAALQAFHAQAGQRSSVLHQALSDYAALAGSLQARLVAVDEAFDVALIAEARALGTKLAAAPAAPPPAQEAVKSAVLARNGLLTLLGNKIALVRKGAAHVFRAFPETYREVTSTYERRRRAAARRAKGKEAGKAKGEGGG